MIGLGLGLDCFQASDSVPAFNDFNEINTELWYSLHPNAALVSTVSIGSGVSQITGVNSGVARNATQSTGAFQPTYDATGLNGFPCLKSEFSQMDFTLSLASAGAVLAVVTLPPQAVFPDGFWLLNELANPVFITGNYFDGLGTSLYGVAATTESSPVTASGTGVSVWKVNGSNVEYGWNSSSLTGTFTISFTDFIGFSLSNLTTRLGELVALSKVNSTNADITQAVNILKSRWGIA